MKAVHFGAGNIGRGFIGLVLHNAGYEVVFADVDAALIDSLAGTPSYQVREVGINPVTLTVDNYRALNSRTNEAGVVAEIATADVVTTAVGAGILRFVAPLIAAGLAERSDALAPLTVMACENALNATDLLKAEVVKNLPGRSDEWLEQRAVFANTAVDRIVPNQDPGHGLNVTVEDFFEWAIEAPPFGDAVPLIPEAHFVDDLAPYIERKLFTVNTGHATVAYHGFLLGASTLYDAVSHPEVLAEVRAVLAETASLVVLKHEFPEAEQHAYANRALERFANPHLTDTPVRVGRQPLRKLSRNERFISPAAQLADAGTRPTALLRGIRAALRFDVPEDAESVELQKLLHTLDPEQFTAQVTGLSEGQDIFAEVADVVAQAQLSMQHTR